MKNFLAQTKAWVHWLAAALLSAALAYATNSTVHGAVNATVAGHPKLLAFLAAAGAAALAYARSQKGPQPPQSGGISGSMSGSFPGSTVTISTAGLGKLAALVLCVAVMGSVGCRHNTANMSNPKVALAVTLLDASDTCVSIEDGLSAANAAVEKLEQAEPDYYAHVKPLLKKLSSLNRTAQDKIAAAGHGDATADWKGAVLAIGASVTPADLTTFGFKNPTSQAIVEGGFAALILALNQVQVKFGGAH